MKFYEILFYMKFYVHRFFSTLRIFYVEMAPSEGGGSWETTKNLEYPLVF